MGDEIEDEELTVSYDGNFYRITGEELTDIINRFRRWSGNLTVGYERTVIQLLQAGMA